MGYIVHNAPGIVMLVQPSLDMVRRNITVRIDPLIETTPSLRELVAMGLRLNDEAEAMAMLPTRGTSVMVGTVPAARPALAPIRSRWMG
jgi:phage terminase large subunit GpA-like protein